MMDLQTGCWKESKREKQKIIVLLLACLMKKVISRKTLLLPKVNVVLVVARCFKSAAKKNYIQLSD